MRKGKSTEAEEMMITDWISSNLPLCHEGLRRRLQVPLEQIVIDIHVKPAPQARIDQSQSNGKKSNKPTGKHFKIAHILSASQLLCAILHCWIQHRRWVCTRQFSQTIQVSG